MISGFIYELKGYCKFYLQRKKNMARIATNLFV